MLLLGLSAVALLGGCCCEGGRGGTADDYEYQNQTADYNQGNYQDVSNYRFNNNASHGTGTATAMNSGIIRGN